MEMQRSASFQLPAPTGGINTVDPAVSLQPNEAHYAYNLVADVGGMRVRTGWEEWVTDLTGATDNTVRSVLPFHGSRKNGSTDKLFACTSSGIWDISSRGSARVPNGNLVNYSAVSADGKTYTVDNPIGAKLGDVFQDSAGATGVLVAINTAASTFTFDRNIPDINGDLVLIDTTYAPPTQQVLQPVVFPTQVGDAGYGTAASYSTPGGRFLVYCDEENGAYVWSENAATWTALAAGVNQSWQPQTTYLVGDRVINGGNTYTCTVGGLSSNGVGPAGTGAGIVEGGVTWTGTAGVTANSVGPSLADQHNALAGLPTSFAFAFVSKSRLWLVERDSARAWYTGVNQLYGVLTSFDFGTKAPNGGYLAGLFDWSYDAGGSASSKVVAVFSSGDIVVYGGSGPASSDWGEQGAWSLGGVPYGRHLATRNGGDLLIMTSTGVVPMSKLVVGQPVIAGDRSVYATGKISSLFSGYVSTYGSLQGWSSVIHPQDNALMVLVPTIPGQPVTQLVMSFATRGWTTYRDLPAISAAAWERTLYFGTSDGRVGRHSGYVDGVQLLDPNQYSRIAWSVLPAYSEAGSPNFKLLQACRVKVQAGQPNPLVQATARLDYDVTEPAAPAPGAAGAGTWDNALWDTAVWGNEFTPTGSYAGLEGVGYAMSVALRGLATTRMTINGVDVWYESGGPL